MTISGELAMVFSTKLMLGLEQAPSNYENQETKNHIYKLLFSNRTCMLTRHGRCLWWQGKENGKGFRIAIW
jgi:hypothetical protein